ncbi:hypothetical protein CO230_04460 [Chryseobacterium sp. 6424]|uniref:hypothetical protein n=1 Tax=Chryseobacterium sp. 6424 TaxID=2039166 RepID=UPI000EFBC6BB|nr:hypothetical protein [Chryseobacterium sp. 6424]AYO57440.1 hypothetical protein CO230_04460 [Chryseobacterium sp. 6424]
MNKELKIPPKSVAILTKSDTLAKYFSELVGQPFTLTGKTRTDGSNIRKLIASTLEKHPLPELAEPGQFEIVHQKRKASLKLLVNLSTPILLQVEHHITCKFGIEFQQRKHYW